MVFAKIIVPAFRERLYPSGKLKILNKWSMQELNWFLMFNIISTTEIMVIGSLHGMHG